MQMSHVKQACQILTFSTIKSTGCMVHLSLSDDCTLALFSLPVTAPAFAVNGMPMMIMSSMMIDTDLNYSNGSVLPCSLRNSCDVTGDRNSKRDGQSVSTETRQPIPLF